MRLGRGSALRGAVPCPHVVDLDAAQVYLVVLQLLHGARTHPLGGLGLPNPLGGALGQHKFPVNGVDFHVVPFLELTG